MQFTYIDPLGQQQVGLIEQAFNLISMGQIHPQTPFFDVTSMQWQNFGYIYPHYFQQVTNPEQMHQAMAMQAQPEQQAVLQPQVLVQQTTTSKLLVPVPSQAATLKSTPQLPSTANPQTPSQTSFREPASTVLTPQQQAAELMKNSMKNEPFPLYLLCILIGLCLLTLILGQYGISYWLTLTTALIGIIIFTKMELASGLQKLITVLLCALAWLVPVVSLVEESGSENKDTAKKKTTSTKKY